MKSRIGSNKYQNKNKPKSNSNNRNELYFSNNYMSDTRKIKYSAERKRIGEQRVKWVKNYYENLGYKVTIFPIEDNTRVDVIAENAEEVLGIEVQNWKESCYLSMNRFKGYVAHWKRLENELRLRGDKRRYRKILFYSYIENIKFMYYHLKSECVELKEFGYQDIPEEEDIAGWME